MGLGWIFTVLGVAAWNYACSPTKQNEQIPMFLVPQLQEPIQLQVCRPRPALSLIIWASLVLAVVLLSHKALTFPTE